MDRHFALPKYKGLTKEFRLHNCSYAIPIHTTCMLLAYALLFRIGIIDGLPNSINLLSWDAKWFDIIRSSGYY